MRIRCALTLFDVCRESNTRWIWAGSAWGWAPPAPRDCARASALRSLRPNAQIVLLPASFNTGEDWPMFQRAYFAAWILGVADRTHRAMFDAIWKTGELAVSDPVTHRLKTPQPSLEDAARCYARIAGINPTAFLATARSFAVDMKIRAADAQVAAMQVPGTPCIVVNGKYRVNMDSLGNNDELIDLVRFLVTKESR